jgi:uncharacterized protein (TIGR03437 family)
MRPTRGAFAVLLLNLPLFSQLQFLNPGADWASQSPAVVSDAAGNTYIVSNTSGPAGVTAIKRDSSGRIVYSFAFAADLEATPIAAAVDSRGNLWIGGWTKSSQFPLVSPLLRPLPPDGYSRLPRQGFVAKVDAAGTRLLFSTLIGGSDPAVPFAAHTTGLPSSVSALAVDGADNLYIAGFTESPTFPVTKNAFQKTGGGLSDPTQTDNSDIRTSSFVMKISNAGDALLYSTYLGGNERVCAYPGGSACSAAVVTSLAVDGAGRATVAGVTVQPDFPVTAGAFQADCHCAESHGSVFVTRLAADASRLEWSTFLGDSSTVMYGASGGIGSDGLRVAGLALDDAGNAIVAGTTVSSTFPVTSGALQATDPVTSGVTMARSSGFVAVIARDGASVLHATYFGGTASSQLRGMARDASGNLWITGEAASNDLPKPAGCINVGSDYVAELDASLSRVMRYYGVPKGAAGRTITGLANRGVMLTGASNAVVTVPEGGPRGPSVWGVAGLAESAVSRHIAPGEVISLFGTQLGPAVAAGVRLDASGRVATELGGTRVLVNGTPAPLLYASATQINLVIPFSAANATGATIQVSTPGGADMVATLQVDAARPQIASVLLNEDGSVNDAAHPATRGSVVTMWATGAGAMDGGMVDGLVGAPPLGRVTSPVYVALSRLNPPQAGEVIYAGAAPGLVAGVVQVNFRVPEFELGYGTCHGACPVVLSVGTQRSTGVDPVLNVVE